MTDFFESMFGPLPHSVKQAQKNLDDDIHEQQEIQICEACHNDIHNCECCELCGRYCYGRGVYKCHCTYDDDGHPVYVDLFDLPNDNELHEFHFQHETYYRSNLNALYNEQVEYIGVFNPIDATIDANVPNPDDN